jgi:predicted ATPase with chaperone activity
LGAYCGKLRGDRLEETPASIGVRVQATRNIQTRRFSNIELSARVYHRSLKLGRTIADLAEALHAARSTEAAEMMMG